MQSEARSLLQTSKFWHKLTLGWQLWSKEGKSLALNVKRKKSPALRRSKGSLWPPGTCCYWCHFYNSFGFLCRILKVLFFIHGTFDFPPNSNPYSWHLTHKHEKCWLTYTNRWVPPPNKEIKSQLQGARLFSLLWSNLVQKSFVTFAEKPHPLCRGIILFF